nr:antibiotic biosynthesis monooxygenase [Pelagibacterium limicola]
MNQGDRSHNKMGAVHLVGDLHCASREEAEIVQKFLPEHVRLTVSEPGCLSFQVVQTEDPLIWRVEERFIDKLAFEAHQARTRASAWGVATASIRREYEILEDSGS